MCNKRLRSSSASLLTIAVVCVLLTFISVGISPARAEESSGSAAGKIVSRTETTIDVQGDNDKQPTRYLLPVDLMHDPKSLQFMKNLAVGDQVKLTWMAYHGHRLISHIDAIKAAAGEGKLIVGTVTAADTIPGKLAWIEIKDDAGNTERYSPAWGEGGLNKLMLAAIALRNIGDRVEIQSSKDDHIRVTSMRVVSLASESSRKPSFQGGDFTGRVTAKAKDSITIKTDSGEELHLIPQDIIGSERKPDPAMLKAIEGTKIGERVEGQWFTDGAKRLISLQPAAKAGTQPASDRAM